MKRKITFVPGILSLAIVLGTAFPGRGEPPSVSVPHSSRQPQIDGQLSDGEWKGACKIVLPGKDDSRTVVRLVWTEAGLYLALEAIERTPFSREPDPREGSLHQQDVFEIFIDPLGDARQYYEIQIALSGASFFKNFLLTADPAVTAEGFLDEGFRERHFWPGRIPTPGNFQSAKLHDAASGVWTAEVFLPADFLNKRRGETRLHPCRLRVNFARHDWWNEKDAGFSYWAPVKPGHPHISPTLMGTLVLEEPAEK